MHRSLSRLTVVVLLAVASACKSTGGEASPACCSTSLSESDLAGIHANSEAWLKAVRAADWDAVAAGYTSDALLMPPDQPAVIGREGIRAWFAGFPPLVSMATKDIEVDGCCDLAYVRGTYQLEVRTSETTTHREAGKYIEIRRKQADGTWLKSHDMFSASGDWWDGLPIDVLGY
jgi:ketosteroid isomerase-like protein